MKKNDPIVPGKLITLSNGDVIASPARKSFLKERGLSTIIHQATVEAYKVGQASVKTKPIRSEGKIAYGYCQAKRRILQSNFRKLFRDITEKCQDNILGTE